MTHLVLSFLSSSFRHFFMSLGISVLTTDTKLVSEVMADMRLMFSEPVTWVPPIDGINSCLKCCCSCLRLLLLPLSTRLGLLLLALSVDILKRALAKNLFYPQIKNSFRLPPNKFKKNLKGVLKIIKIQI